MLTSTATSHLSTREGLLDLFLIFIANRDMKNSPNKITRRGWWAPPVLTASIASARYFLRHVSRQNTIMQAQRNISCHYNLVCKSCRFKRQAIFWQSSFVIGNFTVSFKKN